jgi:hypothetical protein
VFNITGEPGSKRRYELYPENWTGV